MSLGSLLTQTVTRVRYTYVIDALGNEVRGSSNSTTYKARMEATAVEEARIDRSTQISEWRAFLHVDADIQHRDQIISDGVTFEVIGPARVHRTPGGPHHQEVRLRYVE